MSNHLKLAKNLALMAKTILTAKSDDGLDKDVLDQLVQDFAESSGMSDWRNAEATPEVMQAAETFKDELRDALHAWVARQMGEAFKATDEQYRVIEDKSDSLFYEDGAYAVYQTLSGAGVGIWDGRWSHLLQKNEIESLQAYLKSHTHLMKAFRNLSDVAIPNAADETGGYYPPDDLDPVNVHMPVETAEVKARLVVVPMLVKLASILASTRNLEVVSKYDDIDFSPPKEVQKAAALGLELRKEFNRGGTPVGVARARDLANAKSVSPETINRMVSFFARHEVDKKASGGPSGDWNSKSNPSAGYIAWLLWGGDPGYAWALRVQKRMRAKDDDK